MKPAALLLLAGMVCAAGCSKPEPSVGSREWCDREAEKMLLVMDRCESNMIAVAHSMAEIKQVARMDAYLDAIQPAASPRPDEGE